MTEMDKLERVYITSEIKNGICRRCGNKALDDPFLGRPMCHECKERFELYRQYSGDNEEDKRALALLDTMSKLPKGVHVGDIGVTLFSQWWSNTAVGLETAEDLKQGLLSGQSITRAFTTVFHIKYEKDGWDRNLYVVYFDGCFAYALESEDAHSFLDVLNKRALPAVYEAQERWKLLSYRGDGKDGLYEY